MAPHLDGLCRWFGLSPQLLWRAKGRTRGKARGGFSPVAARQSHRLTSSGKAVCPKTLAEKQELKNLLREGLVFTTTALASVHPFDL